jgi:hypothetical protein
LFGEPGVDFYEFFMRFLIVVGLVRQVMVILVNVEPSHPRLANAIGVLQGGDARHAIGEGIDE